MSERRTETVEIIPEASPTEQEADAARAAAEVVAAVSSEQSTAAAAVAEAASVSVATAEVAGALANAAAAERLAVADERTAEAITTVSETIGELDQWRTQTTEILSALTERMAQSEKRHQELLSLIQPRSENSLVEPETAPANNLEEGEGQPQEVPERKRRHRFL